MYIIDQVHIRPSEQSGPHSQDNWELTYILNGAGIRTVETFTEPFQDGEVVLVPPGLVHKWQFNGGDVDARGEIGNITLLVPRSFLDGVGIVFPDCAEAAAQWMSIEEAVRFGGRQRLLLQELMLKAVSASGAARAAAILQILEAAADHSTAVTVGRKSKERSQIRLERIRIWTSCNYARTVRIADVARHVGMNPSAFCSFFRKATGQSYISYLTAYRVDRAKEQLKLHRADKSIAEIGASVGFDEPAHFTRTFHKLTGVPPSAWTG